MTTFCSTQAKLFLKFLLKKSTGFSHCLRTSIGTTPGRQYQLCVIYEQALYINTAIQKHQLTWEDVFKLLGVILDQESVIRFQLFKLVGNILNQESVFLFQLFKLLGIFLDQGSVICSQLVNCLLVVLNQPRVVETIGVDVLEQSGIAQLSLSVEGLSSFSMKLVPWLFPFLIFGCSN